MIIHIDDLGTLPRDSYIRTSCQIVPDAARWVAEHDATFVLMDLETHAGILKDALLVLRAAVETAPDPLLAPWVGL